MRYWLAVLLLALSICDASALGIGKLGRQFSHLGGSGGNNGAALLARITLSASTLAENSAAGTAIGTLATVNTTGGPAVFTLVDSASSKIALSGTNNVNVVAGATASNYEATPFFTFTVSVSGVVPPIANRTFIIAVTDVNEFPPVITSNGGGATAAISIAENTTAVTTVTATDADTANTITYSISGGADAAKFTIGASTGVLAFLVPPDFEVPTDADTNNQYIVIVRASDGSLTDTQTITVTITDVIEGPINDLILLADGTSKILQTDGTSKIVRAGP